MKKQTLKKLEFEKINYDFYSFFEFLGSHFCAKRHIALSARQTSDAPVPAT